MKTKTKKCVKYRKCKNVPCNHAMNGCRPSYCVPGSSRNWTLCNMSEWGGEYKHLKKHCKDDTKCKIVKSKVTKDTVDSKTLHNKMPYIWRFLKPKTRKMMIKLANKPTSTINIPFHIWPDKNPRLNAMTKRHRKLFKQLRKTYKNI